MLVKINWNPDRRQLRNFGLTMLIGLGVLGSLLAWKHHSSTPVYACGAIGVAILVISVVSRPVGLLLYRIWMGLGYGMGMVMSPIFLGLVYFVVFTPVGLLMRLVGRDPMQRRKPSGGTYWRKVHHNIESSSYERQF